MLRKCISGQKNIRVAGTPSFEECGDETTNPERTNVKFITRQRLRRSPDNRKRRTVSHGSGADSARLFDGEIRSPVLQLQRTLGNQRVAQLIHAKHLTPQGTILGEAIRPTTAPRDGERRRAACRVLRAGLRSRRPRTAASKPYRARRRFGARVAADREMRQLGGC